MLDRVTKFVFEQLAAYLVPVMSTATNTLMTGSASVIHDVDQFQVFDDPRASDPTHSFLSKDHFSTILNEPAGLIAQTVVRHVVKNVVQAWDHQRTDPNQVVNDALGVLHHPYFTSNSPIQQEMAATMTKWFNEQQEYVSVSVVEHRLTWS